MITHNLRENIKQMTDEIIKLQRGDIINKILDYGVNDYIESKKYKANNEVFRIVRKKRNTIFVSNGENENVLIEVNNINQDLFLVILQK